MTLTKLWLQNSLCFLARLDVNTGNLAYPCTGSIISRYRKTWLLSLVSWLFDVHLNYKLLTFQTRNFDCSSLRSCQSWCSSAVVCENWWIWHKQRSRLCRVRVLRSLSAQSRSFPCRRSPRLRKRTLPSWHRAVDTQNADQFHGRRTTSLSSTRQVKLGGRETSDNYWMGKSFTF